MSDRNTEKIDLIRKSFELKCQEKYKEAIEYLYKALEYNDNKDDNVEILAQIGELHMNLSNLQRALEEFQKALQIDPNHNLSKQKCYEIYLLQNKTTKAIEIARKMCETDPSAQNYYFYFNALIVADKKQDAIELFNSLDEVIKLDADVLYLISTISPPKKKKILLERVLEEDEKHQQANLDLAIIEFEEKNYDKVIRHCLALDDTNPLGQYYLGRVEALRNNFKRAADLFIQAIKLDDDKHDFYLDLAKAYIDSSNFREALEALKLSINYSLIRNDKASLDEKYFLSGWILIKQNEDSNAMLNLNLIDENSRLYNNAQILIQTINLKNNNLSDAKLNLEKYYEKEKTNPILLESLAGVYKELKLYKKAIEMYRQALNLYPNSLYYTLELIDLYIDDKNYSDSMELIKSVKVKYSHCASIYNSLARIYYRLKDLNSALLAINQYLELDKNRAESFYFKGLILNDLDRFEEAKHFIYTAIRLKPTVAKYYSQMARAYVGCFEYENGFLYSKEAVEIDKNNIRFKKQAYEISLKIGDQDKIKIYEKLLKRSENITKLKR